MSYQIGEVATLTRVSIRTLRHYDDIGLLQPCARSAAGYRLYSEADLARLKQILFFKTLGFSLDAIAKFLQNPAFDFRKSLIEQREQVLEKQQNLQHVLTLIDKLLNENHEVTTMSKSTISFSVFDDFDPSIYEEEVEQRWGDSDTYRESARRTKQYSKEDWQKIKVENDAILTRLSELLSTGVKPTDKEAIAAVEAYRLHIDRWYYPCSKAMHAQLGKMYSNDPRFQANFDKVQKGLAQFIADASAANV